MISITEEYEKWLQRGAPMTPEAVRWGRRQLAKVVSNANADGRGRFRASLIGHECDRVQILSFKGAEQNSSYANSFALNGGMSHIRWQMAGMSGGFLERVEIPVRYGNWFRGYADGITSDGRLFEFKTVASMHLKHIKEKGVKQTHRDQMFLYMNALGLSKGVLVFEGRDWLNNLEIDIDMDWDRYHRIILRLKQLKTWTPSGLELLPDMHPECTENSAMRKQCDFSRVCIEQWAEEVFALEDSEDDLSRS